MKNFNKKLYTAPIIEKYSIELEQSLSLGSGNAIVDPETPTLNEEEGQGVSAWETNNF